MFRVRKSLLKKIKNKRGSMVLEYTIGLLMLVIFICFCMDVLFIGSKHYLVGNELSNISRTLSVQSGTQATTPKGFPGGATAYQTNKEILRSMGEVAEGAGFKPGKWELYVTETDQNGKVIRSGVLKENSVFQAEQLNQITVEFKGTYQWLFSSIGIPMLSGDRTLSKERIVMAEYIQNYSK